MKKTVAILFLVSLASGILFGENMTGGGLEIFRVIGSVGVLVFGIWQSILLLKS